MKIFLQREIREAYAHATAGGQALHVCDSAQFVTSSAPLVFRRSRQFAHLFDQDYARLMATAKRLGVRVIVPQHCGTHRQHVDLCGRPLDRAIDEANRLADEAKRAEATWSLDPAQVTLAIDLEAAFAGKQSLMALPPIDGDIDDKIQLFKGYRPVKT